MESRYVHFWMIFLKYYDPTKLFWDASLLGLL